MKAVSTRIEGTSGDFSTRKLACSTCFLCVLPMRLSEENTLSATAWLASMVALCDRSSSTEASMSSLPPSDTPPTRSALFSLAASRRAYSELAPLRDSTKTELPDTLDLRKASAWMETNRSARCLRAFS